MLRIPALLLMASLAAVPPAFAQDAPRDRIPRPQTETKTKTTTPPRAKAPVSGAVYIGDRAPDFELDGSRGVPVKLSSLRGGWVVLAFSDRWSQVAVLDSADRVLRPFGGRVVGVCHEKQHNLVHHTDRQGIGMLLLADATGEISGLYGLYSWATSQTQPGFFILDREGKVHLALLGRLLPNEQMVDIMKLAMGYY